MWKKKALTLTAAAITLVLAGCSSTAPEPQPAPAAVDSQTLEIMADEQFQANLLRSTLSAMPTDDLQDICFIANRDEDLAYDSFNMGWSQSSPVPFNRAVFSQVVWEFCS